MGRFRSMAAVAFGGSLFAIAGCGGGPPPMAPMGPPMAPPQAQVPPYVYGDVIGGSAARVKKAVAAGAKRLAPQQVPAYVNAQEMEFRRQTAGTGVDVLRSGNVLLVRLPASVAFQVGRADIGPQGQSLVGEIAWTLKTHKQSLVDVLGHTDSTGSAASNEALSQRRAQAVAAYLSAHGVSPARVAIKGYGASQPIADNGTESGRALNRRVEVKVVPLR
jgi:outer membrane protein OmpA-like peptidoglycan-associated protein